MYARIHSDYKMQGSGGPHLSPFFLGLSVCIYTHAGTNLQRILGVPQVWRGTVTPPCFQLRHLVSHLRTWRRRDVDQPCAVLQAPASVSRPLWNVFLLVYKNHAHVFITFSHVHKYFRLLYLGSYHLHINVYTSGHAHMYKCMCV
jgi:hypothetical protein